MAVATADTLRRIRRFVRDDDSNAYIYLDDVYYDAVQFALEKLSRDLGKDPIYADDTEVEQKNLFLLIKIAAIEMAYIRAQDAAESGTAGDITMISVPDLSIQEGGTTAGADIWIELADRLQKEYDDEVGKTAEGTTPGATDNLPTVQSATMFRMSLRTGTRSKYGLDQGTAAPANLVATVDGADVILTWDAVFDDHFLQYEIFQALAPDTLVIADDSQRILIVCDPHGILYGTIHRTRTVVSDLDPGTYTFSIAAVNDNGLYAFGDTVTAVVP